jgi:hypothetical protein
MRMMSICLTRFHIGGLVEPNIYQNLDCFTMCGDFTWRVSDCEELVGEVNHTLSCELTFLVSETFATNQLH